MVIGYEGKEADFQRRSKLLHDTLLHYHELFDVYTAYPGVENLKKINEEAGKAPVKVDKEIMALLKFGKEIYQDTDGRVNIAYGAVLSLWHEKREEGRGDRVSGRGVFSFIDMRKFRRRAPLLL